MWRIFIALAIVLNLPVLDATGKQGTNMFNHFPAPLRRSLADARREAFGALSKDHHTRVELLTADVSAGRLEPRVAASRIDAFLTASESAAVLAAGETYTKALRSYLQGMPRRPTGMKRPEETPGLTLIMLSTVMDSPEPGNSP